MTLRRPPVFATILTLCALAVLVGLGTWQVQRLQWKRGLLSELARVQALDEADLPVHADTLGVARVRAPARVRVTGFYTGPVIALESRTWRGRPGYHVLMTLRLPDGGALLVNRGWVARGDRERVAVPEGAAVVTGLLRTVEKPGRFVPPNDPARGQWYSIDPAAMAGQETAEAAMPFAIVPYILYAQAEAGLAAEAARPVAEALRWDPPNNHLGYALFWFTMAGVLAVIYVLRFLRPAR